jgi:GMP synthase-like glutamine amidotransferase
MIAEALWPGGVRSAEQIEVGLTEIQWRYRESERLVVPTFHYELLDRSTVVGGSGEVVADNAHSPVQGFRLGAGVWGLQFHPEFEPADLRRIVMHHRRTIEARRGTAESALRSVDQLESRWTRGLFDRIFHDILEP